MEQLNVAINNSFRDWNGFKPDLLRQIKKIDCAKNFGAVNHFV